VRRSSIRDFAAEAALLAGGARAILLQVADPVVAAGVARHSDFASQPLARLRATLRYAYSVVLGSAEQADRTRLLVERAHRPIAGASDPELQLWVAATLYQTAADLDERIFGRLEQESAERVYRHYAVLGTALQMPAESWPTDRAAFRAYWDQRLTGLRVTDDARRILLDLLHPKTGPWWLHAGMPLARLLTAGLLPAELRTEYGLPWSVLRERQFRRTMRLLAVVYRCIPRRIRHWPARHYLGPPRADRG
jgi:uncharacterized protein (DUF2236 family)